ncbi:hypothetical protein EYZ11_012792 [Aspergillus tanneri]|uniref:HMG box domain-containing protein n=1 Tax=Aspergillus tanneri TaxID=1220188 RepID=A0A4S3IZC4_9EURO|nr:uncharacterized protein ATNIH1004_001041 [Aspergillus tanneri]KAA8652137.1 hypothetical protein ATNIH1004_001041 [Aspergillus tanneri]THC87763.1 hypothetical protein EYZ11_012792 [Aspergillus tanneri]
MPFNVAPGRAVLRNLRLNAFSRPMHAPLAHSQVRRVCLATHRGTLKPFSTTVLSSSPLFRQQVNAYSTASDSSKKKTASKAGKASKKTTGKKKATKPKELSEKQKLTQERREFKKTIEALKITALEPPKRLVENLWNLAVQTKLSETKGEYKSGKEIFKAATDLAKNISQEEKESFAATVKSNKEANEVAYKEWIKSHPAVQVRDANIARRRLARLTGRIFPPLRDDRLVKRPRNAFSFYMKERYGGGDFKHMTAPEMISQARQEWQGMTNIEKEKYEELKRSDKDRYIREYQEAYGEEPKLVKRERESA